MSAIKNSYLYSRIAVGLSVGSIPNVTIACSTFRVNELAYRTSPTRYELISRHVSRADHLQTFQVDLPMLERIRCAMKKFSTAARQDTDEYLMQDKAASSWFFQPTGEGWFAMFAGQPNDARAFHRWLTEILA